MADDVSVKVNVSLNMSEAEDQLKDFTSPKTPHEVPIKVKISNAKELSDLQSTITTLTAPKSIDIQVNTTDAVASLNNLKSAMDSIFKSGFKDTASKNAFKSISDQFNKAFSSIDTKASKGQILSAINETKQIIEQMKSLPDVFGSSASKLDNLGLDKVLSAFDFDKIGDQLSKMSGKDYSTVFNGFAQSFAQAMGSSISNYTQDTFSHDLGGIISQAFNGSIEQALSATDMSTLQQAFKDQFDNVFDPKSGVDTSALAKSFTSNFSSVISQMNKELTSGSALSQLQGVMQQVNGIITGADKSNTLQIGITTDTAQLQAIKDVLADLGKPIDVHINANPALDELNVLTDAVTNALGNIQTQQQQVADEASKVVEVDYPVGKELQQVDLTGVTDGIKYYQQLSTAIASYNDAINDSSAKAISVSVTDMFDNGERAAVKFVDSLGRVTTAMFKLNDVQLADGSMDKQWQMVGQQMVENYQAQEKAAERASATIAKFQAQLNTLSTKGLGKDGVAGSLTKQTNIDSFESQVKSVQQLIDGLQTDSSVEKINAVTIAIKGLGDSLSLLNSSEKGATSLAASTFESNYTQYLNNIKTLENQLKGNGLFDKFSSQINTVKQSLLSTTDSKGVSAWMSDWRELISQIKYSESTIKGKGIMTAFEINTDQIARVQQLLGMLKSAGDTETVQKLRTELQSLGNDYANLSNRFANGSNSRERFQGMELSLQSLDERLKSAESTARQFDSTIGSQLKQESFGVKIDQFTDGLDRFQEKYGQIISSNTDFQDRFNAIWDGLKSVDSGVGSLEKIRAQFSSLEKDVKAASDEIDRASKAQTANTLLAGDKSAQSSALEKYKKDLQESGLLTKEFESAISSLSTMLGNVDDGDGLKQWKQNFAELKAQVDSFKGTDIGKTLSDSMANATKIDTSTITNLSNMFGNDLIQNGATIGVEEIRGKIQSLIGDYQALSAAFKNQNMNASTYSQLTQQLSDLDVKLKDVTSDFTKYTQTQTNSNDLAKTSASFEDLRTKLENFGKEYESIINKNEEFKATFEQLKANLSNGDVLTLSRSRAELNDFKNQVRDAAGESLTFSSILKDNFGAVGSYLATLFSGYKVITKTVSFIKTMVTNVKELDSALADLQKVTGLSGDELKNFSDKAFNMGSEVGRTGKDVVEATATFSRAGYNLSESEALSKSALVMTNIGVDIASTAEAASDMISILKAYDIAAEDSMDIIDQFYNVSNKQPLDYGNLTDMMVTSGGTLAQAGNSLQESMGLLTAGFATMRDTSVANGLIMISQRLRAVNEDGEAIDGLMPKLEDDFKMFGSSITDEDGNLRSTYELLKDLSEGWDDLSDKQRQKIATDVASNRQVKTLNAILQNWDIVEATIADANNSAGTALEGNAIYMDTIEGRLTALSSSVQKLSSATINSGFVKFIVSAGNAVVNLITDLGGLVPILTGVLGVITAIKSAKIAEGLKNIGTAIAGLFKGGSALTGITGWVGIAIAAAAAIASIVNVVNTTQSRAQEKLDKKFSEAASGYQEEKNKIEEINAELKTTQDRIDELNSKDSLTIIEQDELDKLVRTNAELQTTLSAQKEMARQAQQKEMATAVEAMNNKVNSTRGEDNKRYNKPSWLDWSDYKGSVTYQQQVDLAVRDIQTLATRLNSAQKDLDDAIAGGDDSAIKSAKERRDKQREYYDEAVGILSDYYNTTNEYLKDFEYVENPQTDADKNINVMFDNTKKIEDLLSFTAGITSDKATQSSIVFEKFADSVDKLSESFEKNGEITAEVLSQYPELIAEFEKYGWTIDEIVQHLNETFTEVESAPDTTMTFGQVADGIYTTADSYTKLKKAIDEQNKSGVISTKTFRELSELIPEASGWLEQTADGYRINTKEADKYISSLQDEDEYYQYAIEHMVELSDRIEELKKNRDEIAKSHPDIDAAGIDQYIAGLEDEFDQWAMLVSEIDNATSAISRYIAAKSSADDDALFKSINGVYKEYSEARKIGKTGTDQFKEATALALGDNWAQEWAGREDEAYKQAEKSLKRYTAQSRESDNYANLMKDLAKAGIGRMEGDQWILDEQTSLQEMSDALAAKGMYASTDLIRSVFGLAETYDAQIDWGMILDADGAQSEAEVIKQSIESLQHSREVLAEQRDKYDNGSKEYEALDKQVQQADYTIEVLSGNAEVDDTAVLSVEERLQALEAYAESLKTKGIEIPLTVTGELDKLQQVLESADAGDKQVNVSVTDDGSIEIANTSLTELDGKTVTPDMTVTDDSGSVSARQGELDALNTTTIDPEVHVLNSDGSIASTQEELDNLAKGRTAKITAEYVIGDGTPSSYLSNKFVGSYFDSNDSNATAQERAFAKANTKAYNYALSVLNGTEYVNGSDIFSDMSQFERVAALSGAINELGNAGIEIPEILQTRLNEITQGINTAQEETSKALTGEYGTAEIIEADEQTKGERLDKRNEQTAFSVIRDFIDSAKEQIKNAEEKYGTDSDEYKKANLQKDAYDFTYQTMLGKNPETAFSFDEQANVLSRTIDFLTGKGLNIPETLSTRLSEIESILDFGKTLTGSGGQTETEKPTVDWSDVDWSVSDANIEASNVDLSDESKQQGEFFRNFFKDYEEPTAFGEKPTAENTSFWKPNNGTIEFTSDVEVPVTAENGSGQKIVDEVQGEVSGDNVEIGVETGSYEVPIPSQVDKYALPQLTPQMQQVDMQVNPDTSEADAAKEELSQPIDTKMTVDADITAAQSGITSIDAAASKSVSKPFSVSGLASALSNATALNTRLGQSITKTVTVRTLGNIGGAFAKGTRNAPNGMSLVDERGAELIEHVSEGTYELGTNNGARFTNLNPGDIVHTAAETRNILARAAAWGSKFAGGIKGFFGKAFRFGTGNAPITGGAFAVSTKKVKETFSGFFGGVLAGVKSALANTNPWTGGGGSSKKKKSSGSGGGGGGSSTVKKQDEWFNKLFDWVEVRLKRLQEQTDRYTKAVKAQIGYAAKNEELAKSIASVTEQIDANTQAYDKYMETADRVAAQYGLSAEIIEKVKNGSIEIAEYDKDTQTHIQNFQTYYEKAIAAKDAVVSLQEEQRKLATQKLDSITKNYDALIKLLDDKIDQIYSELDLKTVLGKEIFAEDYQQQIEAASDEIKQYTSAYEALVDEFNSLVSSGLIQENSDEWLEYSSTINEAYRNITEANTALIKIQDTVNELSVDKLKYQFADLENLASKITNLMDLHSAQTAAENADEYRDLIENGMKEIDNLEEQNKLLEAQLEGLDPLSKKYKDISDQLQSNLDDISKIKVEQEKWNDSILDLQIDELQKYKEELQKVNSAYADQKELQDAIEQLEKARSQRNNRVYRENVGFVYESDADALKQAQDNLDNVIENQLLGKIDDLIDAIEEYKNDTNVYDYEGNLLGTEYNIPIIANYTDLLKQYGSSTVFADALEQIKENAYKQITDAAASSNNVNVNIGDIVVNEAENGNELAQSVIDQFPNALLSALYGKN